MTQESSTPTHQPINWRSRIVRTGKILASQVTPHPDNPRRHPQFQRDVVAASVGELGQIAPIIINVNNGYLVDGEERSWLALDQPGDVELDVIYVDLTEEEHHKALLYLDNSGALAEVDVERLNTILKSVTIESPALSAMVHNLAQGMYAPLYTPDLQSTDYNADDVAKAAAALAAAGGNRQQQEKVMCPHCGGIFYLDP